MKKAAVIVVVVVLVAIAGFVAWSLGAERALSATIAEVDARHQIEGFLDEYPRRDTSTPAAMRADEIAGRFGLHVIPSLERVGEAAAGADEWESVKGDMSDYISTMRSGSNDEPPPIPSSVTAFLDAHAKDLDELEEVLLGDEEIRFTRRLDLGPEAPLPNLLGQVSLTRLLATRAMAAHLRGDDAAAWKSLDAARRLERTLSDQPQLICRLISIADLKIIAAAARRLEPPVPGWMRELESIDPRKEVSLGMRAEMWSTTTLLRNIPWNDWSDAGTDDKADLAKNPLSRPIAIWSTAYGLRDLSAQMSKGIESEPCEFDPQQAIEGLGERPPWVVSIPMPNLVSAFSRANQAAVAIEGTNVVLSLKENPQAVTEFPSDVCKGESWVAETRDDGSIHVRFTGRVIAPDGQPEGSLVATEHVITDD